MKKENPKYTSIDLTYETLGSAAFVDAIKVVIVSTGVTPRPTLAGEEPRFIQNEPHEVATISLDGR